MASKSKIKEEFEQLFKDAAAETGIELAGSASTLAKFAADQAAGLSKIKGEAGFQDAVLAARDSVALKAGISASRAASAAEQRVVGIIQGSLRIAAAAL